jgi:site-specific recombinase XerD
VRLTVPLVRETSAVFRLAVEQYVRHSPAVRADRRSACRARDCPVRLRAAEVIRAAGVDVRAGLLGKVVEASTDSAVWRDQEGIESSAEFTTEREAVEKVAQNAHGGLRLDLRHSYATWLVSDGVPINAVQKVIATSRRQRRSTGTRTRRTPTRPGSRPRSRALLTSR